MGMVQFINDYAYAWLSCEVFIPGNVCSEALFKGKVFFLSQDFVLDFAWNRV